MITQVEFKQILEEEKRFKTSDNIELGPHPIKWVRELFCVETKETLHLNFTKASKIQVSKYNINKRYRRSITLLRYDSHGIHTNPDDAGGETFNGPHIHIYKEGYGDAIAYPIEKLGLDESHSISMVLEKILNYFNVKEIPAIIDSFDSVN